MAINRSLLADKLALALGQQAALQFRDTPLWDAAVQLAEQKATLEEARREYLRLLPTHTGTAQQFALAVVWLQGQGE